VTLVVCAVVALADLDDGWGLALACAALVGTSTVTALLVRNAVVHEQSDPAPAAGARRPAMGLALVAAVAVAVAIAAMLHDDAATATAPATTSEAVRTVRGFLTAVYVGADAESACAYLTPTEQRRVSATSEGGATCRATFDASGLAGAAGAPTTTKQVRRLPARATALGRAVRVRIGRGAAAHPFVLVPVTNSEREAFAAPASAWRIAAGATALLASSSSSSGWRTP
jgi:hypothetical protein